MDYDVEMVGDILPVDMYSLADVGDKGAGVPLVDVGLCAIVRDEVINPAGGIVDFVHRTVPFVEQATIVDTGSIDGTRELLEEMQSKYSNLKIVDHKFKGYSDARNVSLAASNAEYALVLDADERLLPEDFYELAHEMKGPLVAFYSFDFMHLLHSGEVDKKTLQLRSRLFIRKGARYTSDVWESLHVEGWRARSIDCRKKDVSIKIKHFLTSKENQIAKRQTWYDNEAFMKKAPSEIDGYLSWKQPNQELLDRILGGLSKEAIV